MRNDLCSKDLERLRFLTSNYSLLQGYPMALAGLLYLLWGASLMIWGIPAAVLIHGWLLLPSLAIFIVGTLIISRFQREKYGQVKAARMTKRRALSLIAFGIVYILLVRLAGPDFKNLKLALEPTMFNGGFVLVLLGLLPTFPWRHYAAVGLPLMAVALLPGLHVAGVRQLSHGWGDMGFGFALVLCGVIDRLILLRQLPQPQAEGSHA